VVKRSFLCTNVLRELNVSLKNVNREIYYIERNMKRFPPHIVTEKRNRLGVLLKERELLHLAIAKTKATLAKAKAGEKYWKEVENGTRPAPASGRSNPEAVERQDPAWRDGERQE
jgi:hypothetical protein